MSAKGKRRKKAINEHHVSKVYSPSFLRQLKSIIRTVINYANKNKIASSVVLSAIGSLVFYLGYQYYTYYRPLVVTPVNHIIDGFKNERCYFTIRNRSDRTLYGIKLSILIDAKIFTTEHFRDEVKTSNDLFTRINPDDLILKMNVIAKPLLSDPMYYNKTMKHIYPEIPGLAPGDTATISLELKDNIKLTQPTPISLVVDNVEYSDSAIEIAPQDLQGKKATVYVSKNDNGPQKVTTTLPGMRDYKITDVSAKLKDKGN